MFQTNFLGTATMTTAAGVPPMGSVFNAVPVKESFTGRDLPAQFGPMAARTAIAPALRKDVTRAPWLSFCGTAA